MSPYTRFYTSTIRLPSVDARRVKLVFAVGAHGYANGANGERAIPLTDARGAKIPTTLSDGAEVEVLGWKPGGLGGARYRVRVIADKTEGWLSGTHLRSTVTGEGRPGRE